MLLIVRSSSEPRAFEDFTGETRFVWEIDSLQMSGITEGRKIALSMYSHHVQELPPSGYDTAGQTPASIQVSEDRLQEGL